MFSAARIMTKTHLLLKICILGLCVTCNPAFSATKQQQIYIDNCSTATVGEEFTCDIMYTTSDNNETLTGLGFLIHFDAEKIEWLAFDNVLSTDLIATDSQPSIDSNNTDNDTNTTHFLNTAWASLSGNWPNKNLPIKLYSVKFKVKSGVSTTETTPFHFSATATSIGYDFSYTPYNLQITQASPSPVQTIIPIIMNLLLDD